MPVNEFLPFVVIGGGAAGISAALHAHDAGRTVFLLEAQRHLGGRAASVETRLGLLDNGQHVLMDPCTELFALIRRLGAVDLFTRFPIFFLLTPRNGSIRTVPFRSPFPFLGKIGYLWPLLQLKPLLKKPLQLPLLLRKLQQMSSENDFSFEDWLDRHQVSAQLKRNFFNPVVLSTLSETSEYVSAAAVQKVLRDGIFTGHEPVIYVNRLPLRSVFHDAVINLFRHEKILFRLNTAVTRILLSEEKNSVTGCVLRNGEVIRCRELVIALPPWRLYRLLSESGIEADPICPTCRSGAITSLYLQLNTPLATTPLVLPEGPGQWFFPAVTSCTPPITGNTIQQLLISGSHRLLSCHERQGSQKLIDAAMAECLRLFPTVKIQLNDWLTITTPHAVTVAEPGYMKNRPDGTTPWHNCTIAGDWTRTGWPSTLESAVRSGRMGTELLLKKR